MSRILLFSGSRETTSASVLRKQFGVCPSDFGFLHFGRRGLTCAIYYYLTPSLSFCSFWGHCPRRAVIVAPLGSPDTLSQGIGMTEPLWAMNFVRAPGYCTRSTSSSVFGIWNGMRVGRCRRELVAPQFGHLAFWWAPSLL